MVKRGHELSPKSGSIRDVRSPGIWMCGFHGVGRSQAASNTPLMLANSWSCLSLSVEGIERVLHDIKFKCDLEPGESTLVLIVAVGGQKHVVNTSIRMHSEQSIFYLLYGHTTESNGYLLVG